MIQKQQYKLNKNGVEILTFFEGENQRHLITYNMGGGEVLEAELLNVPDDLLENMSLRIS